MTWVSRAVIGVFALFIFMTGGFIAGVALHDPDTCWMLSMGHWIIDHQLLPYVDPFTSSIRDYVLIPGRPLLEYHWLPEITWYGVYACGGLVGLLAFAALFLYATYFLIPFALLDRARTPHLVTLGLIVLSVLLAESRFLARAHICTFLFLALLLNILLCRDYRSVRTASLQVLLALIVMIFWVNCHIFFPLGLLVLLTVSLSRLAEWLLIRREEKPPLFFLAALPLAGIAATLINPWGFHFWLFFLKILRSPVNIFIEENVPLPLIGFDSALLMVFCLIFVARLCLLVRRSGIKRVPFLAIALGLLGAYFGYSHSRLISIAPLFLIGAIAETNWYAAKESKPTSATNTEPRPCIQSALERFFQPRILWYVVNAGLILTGVFFVTTIIPPTLPQSNKGCTPPFEAIKLIKAHRPSGRVLNDPQFGSIMEWYLENPDVFIDTRFSFFEESLVLDYHKMSICESNWQDILDRYHFDWAFLPPELPIAVKLKEIGWKAIFEDKAAVILLKPNTSPQVKPAAVCPARTPSG